MEQNKKVFFEFCEKCISESISKVIKFSQVYRTYCSYVFFKTEGFKILRIKKFYEYLKQMYPNNFVSGPEDGKFKPYKLINFEVNLNHIYDSDDSDDEFD